MTEWRCGCDTRNWPVTHSCKALTHSGSPSPSIQPIVAKRPSLVQRFCVTCLAQFTFLYNRIRVASTKKALRKSFAALQISTTRRRSECGTCVRTFTAAANAVRLAAESGPPVPRVHACPRPRAAGGGQDGSGLASYLLHELVELDLGLRPFQPARVPDDLLVGLAVAIGLDRGIRIPFRVRDEFGSVPAAQELFRHAALLADHERSAFRLPDPRGLFDLGRIDLDVDEADDRHWGPPGVLLAWS